MQVLPLNEEITQVAADAIVVGLFSDEEPTGPAARLDEATGGLVSRLVERGEIRGKPCEVTPLLAAPGIEAGQAIVVGLGTRDSFDAGTAFRAAGAAVKRLASRERASIAVALVDQAAGEPTDTARTAPSIVASIVAGAIMGSTGQDLFRAEKKLYPPAELHVRGSSEQIEAGRVIGEAVNWARRQVNGPPDEVYPESFAARVAEMGADCGLEVETWDRDRLEAERCGALLAVAQGSVREPRLVIAHHRGGKKGGPVLALVGKGVTFDSGGLSLKPSDSMKAMKCDMAGAATVMGAMRAIAGLKLPVNVVGLAGLAENMPSASAYKLGDVVTARNGTTIEIHNTDAEGRLVLADVLDVAATGLNDSGGTGAIVDLATLTGACVVALGEDVAGLMTGHQEWCDRVRAAADACGEPVWQLPMFDLFDEQIESQVADIKNTGSGRWGGAITAAKLLARFTGDVPWTHIDIAGPAWLEKPKPWCDGGASGQMVRTLIELARSWAEDGPPARSD